MEVVKFTAEKKEKPKLDFFGTYHSFDYRS